MAEIKSEINWTPWGVLILVVLHIVGIAGILWFDQELFAQLTPLVLLISALLIFASQKVNRQGLLIFFLLAYLIGYGVEFMGTSTGIPFGKYHYGPNMAPLVLSVPLIIGVNWFLLTVGAAYWAQTIFSGLLGRVFSTAALMTIFDFFMEPVAITLNFWTWEALYPPLQNYLAWFGVSILLALLGHKVLYSFPNKLSGYYFGIVAAFFIILNIAL